MADLVPKSVSWKTIQNCSIPIRDQDIVPCSWAFGAATLVSYQLRICDKQVWDFEPSVQYLIDHCNGDSSCNGDFSSRLYQQVLPKTRQGTLAVLHYIEKHGVPLETRFPYNFSPQVVLKSEAKGPIIRIHGIVTLPEYTPLEHIKKILVAHPIIASVRVYDSLLPYKFPKGEEDAYATDIGLEVGPPHYLVIIGYGRNQNGLDYYEVHNSWGLKWGNKGYGRILCHLVRPFAYVDKASIDTSSSFRCDFVCDPWPSVNQPWANMEINSEKGETKNPKLITDKDDGVSPMVIYDRSSTTDDPDRFFTDLASLAINFFMKRNVLRRGRLVKLVKVTSVVVNGVMLTLTMIANLKGNDDKEFDTDDPTLEAGILYRGSLLETEGFHVLYVKVCCSRYIKKEETDKILAKYKFNDSDSDSDWDEGEEPDPSLTSEQFVTQLAEVAITTFNAHYPHMPYQFLGLLEFKASPGYFIYYTITMTAKPKPPHDAKTDAPPVQTFLAIMSYQGGLPTEATVQGMIIVDTLQAS